MGISIYYSANRENPFSEEENQKVQDIIKEYSNSFPYKDSAEDFCVYDDDAESEVIFDGSTKLPLSNNIEETIIAVTHWAACLSDIRRAVPDAQWDVHMDDIDLIWDDNNGWQLPID